VGFPGLVSPMVCSARETEGNPPGNPVTKQALRGIVWHHQEQTRGHLAIPRRPHLLRPWHLLPPSWNKCTSSSKRCPQKNVLLFFQCIFKL
jgi:hypothetical protein